MNFVTHGLVGPITALCIYKNKIFAGCGSQVQVYSANNCDLLTSFSALSSAVVHGFELGLVHDRRKCLCVFGAKCVRIFYLDVKTSDSDDRQAAHHIRFEAATAEREFEDWIWAAAWLQNDDQCTVALALAHNVVLHWDWLTDTLLQRMTCTEKCILYCCHFIGSQWSELVLAAGTVFNQVILWSPGRPVCEDRRFEPQPVLHRLMGHQGVIFSIFYHQGLQRICSVSDDRSIIMYQLRFDPLSGESHEDFNTTSRDWDHVTIEPMLTVFGHSGRVWDVVLLTECFVSVGEDANCIVWNYSGDILHKHKGHKGQSIWSLAASEDEAYVVTGGGDCSIRKWQLCSKQNMPLIQSQLIVPDHAKTCAEDFVRTLALWDYDSVVLITDAGSTLCYNIARDTWQILAHDSDFASYATLAVSARTSFLAIGSITGHVRLIHKVSGPQHAVRETKVKVHSGKVCGLTWVNDDHFLTTGLDGHCLLVRVQQTAEEGIIVSILAKLELPACKHRWVVSACLLPMPSPSSSVSPQSGMWAHLVCGDRSGSVHCYQLPYSPSQMDSVLLPAQTFPKIHGKAGVTCVCHHSQTVYTAGRDGQYRRWSLDLGYLQLLNSSRVFKGFDWIDRLWIGDNKQLILGFYSSKFIVWDADQGERQMEVECGGGHRSWDCVAQGRDYRFCFIKAREVIVVDGGQRATQDIVKAPLHGKKVWDMKCLSTHIDSKGVAHHVMCTGSEDTTLSLGMLQSNLEGGTLQWISQHTLHAHLSSVRAVAAVNSPDSRRNGNSHLSEPCAFHQACITNVSPHLPRNRHRSPCCQATSQVVFSGGGRAQIQAWRVTVVEQSSCSHQTVNEQSSCSHQTVNEQSSCLDQKLNTQSSCSHQTVNEQSSCSHQTVNEQSSCSHQTINEQGNSLDWILNTQGSCLHKPVNEQSSCSDLHNSSSDGSVAAGYTTAKQHQRQDRKVGGSISEEEPLEEPQHKNTGKSFPSDATGSSLNSSVQHKTVSQTHIAETSYYPSNQQGSFTTSYQNLGGCFLGESRHKRPHKPWKTRYLKLDPETRIMCLAAVTAQQLHPTLSAHVHLLAAAGSDGILRLFLFDELKQHFSLLCQSSHHNGCILKVLIHLQPCLPGSQPDPSVKSSSFTDHLPILLSAATDGCIAVWNLQPIVHWLQAKGSHISPDPCGGLTAGAHGDGVSFQLKAADLGCTAHPETEERDATTCDRSQGQELISDETSGDEDEDEENDKLTNLSLSSAMHSGIMRTQYLGYMPSPLYCPASPGGISVGVTGLSAAQQKTDPDSKAEHDMHQSWTPDQELDAHQSGVNSLHIKSLADGSLLMASGGDDNTLTVYKLTLKGAGKQREKDDRDCCYGGPVFDVAGKVCKPDAHGAQITGVWILSETHILTASVDQRVSLWRLTQDSQITYERCSFVNIADLSNIEIWQCKNRVYVGLCGEGVALLSIHSHEGDNSTSP